MIRRSTIRRSLHALERDCFYIGALGSKKTHGRRIERLKAQGCRRAARAHPRADRACRSARSRRPRSPSRSWARSRRGCDSRRSSAMKFGAVPVARGRGRDCGALDPPGGLVLKKGTLIGKAEIAALRSRRHRRDRGGADRARRRVRGRRRGRDRGGGRGGGGARRARLHRPRQSVCAKPPACSSWTRTRSIASTRSRNRSPSRRCRPTSRSLRGR